MCVVFSRREVFTAFTCFSFWLTVLIYVSTTNSFPSYIYIYIVGPLANWHWYLSSAEDFQIINEPTEQLPYGSAKMYRWQGQYQSCLIWFVLGVFHNCPTLIIWIEEFSFRISGKWSKRSEQLFSRGSWRQNDAKSWHLGISRELNKALNL
jgi:hypothetical protein